MPVSIPPTKVFRDHVKQLGGIFVDDQYLYTWGPGFTPAAFSYPQDTVYIYDKNRDFAQDGMLVGGQSIRCVASDSKRIFVGGGGGKDLTGYRYSVLCTYDKTTQLLQDDEGGDEYYAVSLFNDGKHLFMGTDGGLIIVHTWDASPGYMTLWPEKTHTCADAIFADESHVYSAGSDGSLIRWKKDKFKFGGGWQGHSKQISQIIGLKNQIFSGDWGGEILLWDANTGTSLARWAGHAGRVNGLALHGSHLFSGGQDQFIKVWSTDTYKELLTLQHHPAPVNALAKDDTFLYAGYGDGVVVVWRLSQVLDRVGGR